MNKKNMQFPTKTQMLSENYKEYIGKILGWNIDTRFPENDKKCLIMKTFILEKEEGEKIISSYNGIITRHCRPFCCSRREDKNKGNSYFVLTDTGKLISWKKENTWGLVYDVQYINYKMAIPASFTGMEKVGLCCLKRMLGSVKENVGKVGK